VNGVELENLITLSANNMNTPPTPKQINAVIIILARNTDYRWIEEMWKSIPKWKEGHHKEANNRELILKEMLQDFDRRDASYFISAWNDEKGYHKIEAFKRLRNHLKSKGI
jgi:hypothetical protein